MVAYRAVTALCSSMLLMHGIADVRERGRVGQLDLVRESRQVETAARSAPGLNPNVANPTSGVQLASVDSDVPLAVNDSIAPPYSEDLFQVSRCVASCMDLVYVWMTPPYITKDVPRSFGMVYSSRQAFVAPVISIDATPGTALAPPAQLSMRVLMSGSYLNHLDSNATEVFFDQDSTRNTNRIAFQFDANHLATGVYDYQAEVRFWRGGTFTSQYHSSKVIVVRRDSARYGAGWAPAGVQQLKVVDSAGSVLIWEADGSVSLFRKVCDPGCSYLPPRGEFSRLAVSDSYYVRTYRDGTRMFFDTTRGLMRSVYDLYGDSTVLGWNQDTLKVIRDPAGFPINLSYDVAGRLWIVQDSAAPGGTSRSWAFNYNSAGEVAQILSNQDSWTTTFTHNVTGAGSSGYRHLISSVTDALGNKDSLEYHFTRKLGNRLTPPISIADSATQKRVKFTTHSFENVLVPALSIGEGSTANPRRFMPTYDVAHTIVPPRGDLRWITTDRYFAPTGIGFSASSRWAQTSRDSHGQIDYARNPRGTIMRFWYDSLGNLQYTENQANGRVDTMTHHTQSVGGVQVTVGPLTMGTNAGLPHRSFAYSGVLLTESRLPTSDTVRYLFRSDGRPERITDPAGHVTEFFYAGSGHRNLDSIRAGVFRTRFSYDGLGRMTQSVSSTGMVRNQTYDVWNRVQKEYSDVPGDTTRFGYDLLRLRSVTDAKNQVYQFDYNAAGWDTASIDPLGRAQRYEYDMNANLAKWTNRRSQVTSYAYDYLDRVISMNVAGTVTTYSHVFNDSLVIGSNAASTDTLRFDLAGRLTRAAAVRSGARHGLTYTYDAADRPITLALDTAGVAATSTEWRYGATTAVVDSLKVPSSGWIRFGITPERMVESISFPSTPARTLDLIGAVNYGPTHASSTGLFNDTGLDALLGQYIQLDSVGRVNRVVDAPQDTFRVFRYDGQRRLWVADLWHSTTSSSCSEGDLGYICSGVTQSNPLRSLQYTYDLVGNPARSGDVVTNGNRLTKVEVDIPLSSPVQYDSLVYDLDGNVVTRILGSGSTQTLSWNAIGQLTSIGSVTFGYDAFGRRTSKDIAGTVTQFIWDDDLLLAERGMGSLNTYTYEPGSYTPLSMTRGSTPHYYSTDEAGSILGVINGAGSIANAYRYFPFGYSEVAPSGVTNPMRFHGQYYDSETDLYYMRNRYYDPRSRRFISEDPIGLAGGMNLYAYAANDPVNRNDASGLQETEICVWVQTREAYVDVNNQIIGPAYEQRCKRFGTPVTSSIRFGNRGATGPIGVGSEYGGGGPAFGSPAWRERASGATHPAAFDPAAILAAGGIAAAASGVRGLASQSLDMFGAARAAGLARGGTIQFGRTVIKWGGLHGPHHTFPIVGRASHLQINWWQPGVRGSGAAFRVPLPWR